MRFVKSFYLLFCLSLLSAAPVRAENPLAAAEKNYAEGQFEKSRDIYRAELSKHDALPAAFYYNYANAAFRAGTAGEAYVALSKALAEKPFDSDIRFNIQLVKEKLPAVAAATRPANWISWWPEELRWMHWQIWVCLTLVLLAPFLWGTRGESTLSWQWSMLVIAVMCLGAGALAAWQNNPPAAGILASTKVKSGPGKSYPEITSIEAGSLVSLEESRDGWFKIRYLNSNLQETVGWIESPTALKL